MPTLTFRIKKRLDAHAVLVLVREDGSSTSGSIGPPGGYGPVHDLAHYVVERTLGLSEGFLGLVTSGWEITDFEKEGHRASTSHGGDPRRSGCRRDVAPGDDVAVVER